MRIALVHYSYLPVIAGVELVMAEHARLFGEAGHEVEVVSGIEGDEGLVERLRPIFARQEVVMLHNVLTMHFHLALTAAVWRLAEELTGVRFVCWVHDLAACNPDYAPLPLDQAPWELLTKAHPRCAYVAVSELRRRQFLELTGQPEVRCRTIPNGVDPQHLFDLPPRVAELAQRHALLERDLVLLHPTRLLRRKNVELTLQVTAALNGAGHSCAALITAPPEIHDSGSGEYVAGLREMRERLGLWNDALFLHEGGPLLDHELHALYRLADALFFPSRQEGFGIPLLEAALHRLPIFCSDIEPLNSLLARGTTTFSPNADPEEVAALIVTTLTADAAHAARLQARRSYSWDAIYRNFLSPLLAETETK
ncbi:MAG: glycosyltransferase family 4 protein [Chthoniobacteraceae bacterium]